MTEVFESWRAEHLQKPQQDFLPPNSMSHLPAHHLHQPLQAHQQAAYYYNNNMAVELPSYPVHTSPALPASPSLTLNSPLRTHPSPALSQTAPNNPYAYREPLQGAVEMPVELPDNTYLAAAALVPARSISTEVSRLQSSTAIPEANQAQKKKKFLSRLF